MIKLLTPEDLAVRLGVSRRWVLTASRSGQIPSLRIGKVYRYRLQDIESWEEEYATRNAV
jgi:excisionase family DNA binding protein